MFTEKGRKLDWLEEDDHDDGMIETKDEHIMLHPLAEQSNDDRNVISEKDDENLPSWLKEEMATTTPARTASAMKPRSTIKYKKVPNRRESSWSSWCCCCPDDPVLYWFRIFHSFCGFTGVLSFLSNLFVLFDLPLDIRNIIIHIYALLLCSIIVAAELEVSFVITQLNILESWIFRGIFYFFVGVISVTTGQVTAIVIYQDIVCIILMVLGLIYLLMGVSCLRSIEQDRISLQSNYYTEVVDDFSSPSKV